MTTLCIFSKFGNFADSSCDAVLVTACTSASEASGPGRCDEREVKSRHNMPSLHDLWCFLML